MYFVKWRTVEGEVDGKRFSSKADPEITLEPLSGGTGRPYILRIESDGELLLNVRAGQFISLWSEDAA